MSGGGTAHTISAAIFITCISVGASSCDDNWRRTNEDRVSRSAIYSTGFRAAIPLTAQDIRYYQEEIRRKTEYLYFSDSREAADRFATIFVGSVPSDHYEMGVPIGYLPQRWWPKKPIPGAREIVISSMKEGRREVWIKDNENYSEVWAFFGHP